MSKWIPRLRKGQILFCKKKTHTHKNTLILSKSSVKLISSKCTSFYCQHNCYVWWACANCAPLLADLFIYSYEADFIHGFLKKNEKKIARSFNFIFYIDDVLSLNNCTFGDCVDRIHHIELEIKDVTDIAKYASYLDLLLEMYNGSRLRTKLYDKRDYFNFPIVNFPFICSNIPAAPIYGVYFSQLIRYSRACGSNHEFHDRGLLLTRKILKQWFIVIMTCLCKVLHVLPIICFLLKKFFF